MRVDEIKRKIIPLLHRHKVKKAGIFGSIAKGDFTENSDLDVLVELEKNLSLLDFIRIKHELEDVLGRDVDLVEYRSIKHPLKKRILSEEIRLYGEE